MAEEQDVTRAFRGKYPVRYTQEGLTPLGDWRESSRKALSTRLESILAPFATPIKLRNAFLPLVYLVCATSASRYLYFDISKDVFTAIWISLHVRSRSM